MLEWLGDVLEALGDVPTDTWLAIGSILTGIGSIGSVYVALRLAGDRDRRHNGPDAS